jgi:predicted transcriptional regulator of viral defense system
MDALRAHEWMGGHADGSALETKKTRRATEPTPAAQEILVAVEESLAGVPHRVAYRSALDYLDLLRPPARAVQVAMSGAVGLSWLGARPMRSTLESEATLHVGAYRVGKVWVSDLERSILDAADRPDLVGHITAVAVAFNEAAPDLDASQLTEYVGRLRMQTAWRRLGSLADQLRLAPLTNKLEPIGPVTTDIVLDPKGPMRRVWRDEKWGVYWNRNLDELTNAIERG